MALICIINQAVRLRLAALVLCVEQASTLNAHGTKPTHLLFTSPFHQLTFFHHGLPPQGILAETSCCRCSRR